MTREELRKIRKTEQERKQKYRHTVNVCMASGCVSLRSDKVKEALEKEVSERGIEDEVLIKRVGCVGLCSKGPIVIAETTRVLYQGVSPDKAKTIIKNLDKAPTKELKRSMETPFFKRQHKIVLEHSGNIDPERIEDYIAVGGYEPMLNALIEMTPAEIIDQVARSGLRGRGGAGYPTGLKWSTVAKAQSNGDKYVICNADEGDPGAYMDRSIMESNPHQIIEGMVIGAYAIGANHGFIYVRAEYPLAIERLRTAIKQAEKKGLLGQNIGGTRFSFDIQLRYGAGAYVTGEETALISSIEGHRGVPHPRPPYPSERGLWGKPTLINNVETFANIAPIIRNGGDWFASIGTEKSKGTKVFALVGKVNNVGLIEVPLGMTLREIIYDLGGGIPEGRNLKAVQTGGPSGGTIPEEYIDLPVDYESLVKVGSIMGSGGMIVMDETSCMVDVAKYFMSFSKSESCGKCIPCRVGTVQMHGILERITNGAATMNDLILLENLSDMVRSTSLCGLGQSAPNPVLSTLRYFKDEYIAHIKEKKCPAGVCQLQYAKGGGEHEEILEVRE
ncbi:MAG: NADH-quinone oxidoreductase subunit NuoF [Firmicutes bacterium]|nr:NADH-quinone oxidoreductase subunit NuoF [Bacillota bacterium]